MGGGGGKRQRIYSAALAIGKNIFRACSASPSVKCCFANMSHIWVNIENSNQISVGFAKNSKKGLPVNHNLSMFLALQTTYLLFQHIFLPEYRFSF
jgi:hypothetical protein